MTAAVVYSLACTPCSRGWEDDRVGPCSGCGQPGQIRDRSLVIPLEQQP